MSVVRSVWEVGKRPPWTLVLVVLGLAAMASFSAAWATLVLGLVGALPLIGITFGALGVDPLNPRTITKLAKQPPAGKELVLPGVGIVLAVSVVVGASRIPLVSADLARWAHGDRDLTAALLVCTLSALIAWLLAGFRQLQLHGTARRDRADMGAARTELPEGSRRFWIEAAISLSLASVALTPAALSANWAWNVLASAVFPVFLVAVNDHRRRLAPGPEAAGAAPRSRSGRGRHPSRACYDGLSEAVSTSADHI